MESELIQFSTSTAFPPAGCRMPPLSSAAASSINELFIKNKFLEGKTDRPISALLLRNQPAVVYLGGHGAMPPPLSRP